VVRFLLSHCYAVVLLLMQDSAAWRDAIYATDFQSKVCFFLPCWVNNSIVSGIFHEKAYKRIAEHPVLLATSS